MGEDCLIGLGGNVGDVAHTFRTALSHLSDAGCRVIEVSSLYQTAAMGPDAGEPFLNAVARITTTLQPHELLALLLETESRCGRVREQHWAPRRVDLDLLDYGGVGLCTQDLVLPHPGIWYRRFVLDPLAEIAADWVHPEFNLTVTDLLHRLSRRPLELSIETAAALPLCPVEFQQSVSIRRIQPNKGTETRDEKDEAFCRIVCLPTVGNTDQTPGPFLLNVREAGLQALVESILAASLGRCEKC